MKSLFLGLLSIVAAAGAPAALEYGPAAALEFEQSYRGDTVAAGKTLRYPDAEGIPFSDTDNIIPMTAAMWTPAQLVSDFQRRMAGVRAKDRKRGIIVLLKTERCCTKLFRGCSVTTAALEKRAAPEAAQFLIYGAWIKPRDNDKPAGSLKIETGADAWKNDAAGVYTFKQGPGATLVFLNPVNGKRLDRTDAATLALSETEFVKRKGQTPKLDAELTKILRELSS